MNKNTITITGLEDLEALLDISAQTIRRCKLKAANGDLAPDEAELIVKDVAETIAKFCGG